MYWIVDEFSVEDGKLNHDLMVVDRDGNWDHLASHDVDDPGYEKWRESYSYEASRKTWCEYYEWVAKHGRDPIQEFFVSRPQKREADWEFVIEQRPSELILVKARPLGKKSWLEPHQLPSDVGAYFDFGDITTIEGIVEAAKEVEWRRIGQSQAEGVATIQITDEVASEAIKKAARKALKECK